MKPFTNREKFRMACELLRQINERAELVGTGMRVSEPTIQATLGDIPAEEWRDADLNEMFFAKIDGPG